MGWDFPRGGPHPPPRHSLLLRPLRPSYSTLPHQCCHPCLRLCRLPPLRCCLDFLQRLSASLPLLPPRRDRSPPLSARSDPHALVLRVTSPLLFLSNICRLTQTWTRRGSCADAGESRVFAFLRSHSQRPPRFRFARLSEASAALGAWCRSPAGSGTCLVGGALSPPMVVPRVAAMLADFISGALHQLLVLVNPSTGASLAREGACLTGGSAFPRACAWAFSIRTVTPSSLRSSMTSFL
ncbi:hypothetical protein B0H13DRAFT_2391992 [Mycena leptocephala]|nr:hypothetical protein B0H13DRAFT_2391992 [Mycena leptocephala]